MDFSSLLLGAIILGKEENAIKKQSNSDQWFLDQLETSIRRQSGIEKTTNCREDTSLRAYAAKPKSFSLSDPLVEHVTSCTYCLQRLLQFRAAQADTRSSKIRGVLVGAFGVACLLIGLLSARVWNHLLPAAAPQQTADLHGVMELTERTLDLTDYGTSRGAGEEPARPPLILPAAFLHLDLILPRFSEAGSYSILVAADRNGQTSLACGAGEAASAGSRATVDVVLDLRGAKPGDYFLVTQLKGQDGSYVYPLKIQ